jgi:hypothetical protein
VRKEVSFMSQEEFKMWLNDKIKKAFKAGEEWGVTYSTWFTPTEEDTEEKIKETIKNILG